MLAERPQEQRMIKVVEEPFDVEIQHPVKAPEQPRGAIGCQRSELYEGGWTEFLVTTPNEVLREKEV